MTKKLNQIKRNTNCYARTQKKALDKKELKDAARIDLRHGNKEMQYDLKV